MDTSDKLRLVSRLVTVLVFALLITIIFQVSLVFTFAICMLMLILMVLGFYFIFTRKEKGPLPNAKESLRISERANSQAFFAALFVMAAVSLLEFLGITHMSAASALALTIILSVLFQSLIREYLSAKEKIR